MKGIWSGFAREGLDIKEKDLVFYKLPCEPFRIYGLLGDEGTYRRLPAEFAKSVSGAVAEKASQSAGGRVRFATDSESVAIRVSFSTRYPGPHVTALLDSGFDLYVQKDGKQTFVKSFYPAMDDPDGYEGITGFSGKKMREFTLNMPIGVEVTSIEIGLKEGSTVERHSDYKIEKPIVFYGSSITHGYAASRPGNIYENFISRSLDCNYINLGFSGSAMGEKNLAEYIAKLDMTAFVLDYDYNAYTVEHLKNTHFAFYETVRKANPDMPIIMVSRPECVFGNDGLNRKAVIAESYLKAKNSGDDRVYFVDGYTFFDSDCYNDCTTDGCHPNDMGFYFMAKKIGNTLKNVIPGEE